MYSGLQGGGWLKASGGRLVVLWAVTLAVVFVATGNSASPLSVDAVIPGVTEPPAVAGVTEVGATLSASTGTWLGTLPLTYAYQWLRCDGTGGGCVEVSGATGSTYPLVASSVGTSLRVRVTVSNTVGIVS